MDNKKLATCYAAAFGTAAGRVVLDDLENRVKARPGMTEMSDAALRELHGQQMLVAKIKYFIEKGEQNG